MADSPGSPLSSHASSEFTDAKLEEQEADHDMLIPSSKRQKIGGGGSYRSTPHLDGIDGDISSDSETSAPSSPSMTPAALTDEDHVEQITACRWRSCDAGDLGNMDALVQHIHDEHIGPRQKKYVCEWEGCTRIDTNHASGYALRAHMRSHTREKPFYCALPECDRSFTRSDALAKHMRTVHETEALRPSDPVPRNHSLAQVKPQRLKLIVGARPSNDSTDSYAEPVDPFSLDDIPTEFHPTANELAIPTKEQYRAMRRRVYWAEQEAAELQQNVQKLEHQQKQEWQQNRLILANLVEAELATAYHSGKADEEVNNISRLTEEMLPNRMLPMIETPWYREVIVPPAE